MKHSPWRNWYILTQMINTILLFRFLTHCEKRTTIIKFISGLWREGCAVIFFLSFRESSYQMSYPISFFKDPSLPFVSTYLGTYLRWICKKNSYLFCFSKFCPNVSLLDNAPNHLGSLVHYPKEKPTKDLDILWW